jgi:multidrug resistance efflux pump
MEILLLLIYSIIVYLIFFQFKLLPWNIISQVIVVTIPVIAITLLILFLNIFAPSSDDVRVINYVVQIVPRVSGRVIEVPVEANRPVKKGDVLFKLDPTPFEQRVLALEAKIPELKAKLISARAYQRELGDQLASAGSKKTAAAAKVVDAQGYKRELEDQLKSATGQKATVAAKLDLARKRLVQTKELADKGAGPKYDFEQSDADVRSLEAELATATANESQIRQKLNSTTAAGELAEVAQAQAEMASAAASESQIAQKLSAKTESGDLSEVAQVKAELEQVNAQLAEARWQLEQAIVYAPADGTVINLQLRPGSFASGLGALPVMSFVENEQWILMFFHQNELRNIHPGDEAEIFLKNYPNRIVKCKVDSIVWASASGQLPISGTVPQTGTQAIPEGRVAIRLMPAEKDKDLFLAAGAQGSGAVFTHSGHMIHIVRKVFLRVSTKLDWLVLKLH